jgi:hypothetical protein
LLHLSFFFSDVTHVYFLWIILHPYLFYFWETKAPIR